MIPLGTGRGSARSCALCRAYRRGPRGLEVDVLDAAFDDGDLAALLPKCQTLVRDVLDVSPTASCEGVVVLDKGGLLPLETASLTLGLGWDPAVSGAAVDLDAGVVLLDRDGIYVDFVYFHNQRSAGVTHSGDNRTGIGDGDDESIAFDLGRLPENVTQAVVVVSAYTGSFMKVRNASCRLVDDGAGGREIARWDLSGMFKETSLVVCKLFRDSGWWKLFVVGEPIGGRSIVEFFFTDTYGEMAELRDRFKTVARVQYSDAQFFAACAARASYGQLSAKKGATT